MASGSCLCGAVHFETEAPLRKVQLCHCGQCRKTSGHYWAATQVPTDALTIHGDSALTWYQSSSQAQRGFCQICGSSLFWQWHGEGKTSIAAGAFDGDHGLTLDEHIFVDDKGSYYDISDGLPQKGQY